MQIACALAKRKLHDVDVDNSQDVTDVRNLGCILVHMLQFDDMVVEDDVSNSL